MKIEKIQLDYVCKNSFASPFCNDIRHIKTLPYLSIVQAIEGNYDIQISNGETHNTGAGGFFVAPANVQQTITHKADAISKNMFCRWVFLKIKINDVYNLDDLYDFPIILPDAYKSSMNLLFDRLFATDNLFDEYIYYYEIVKILFLTSKEKRKIPLYLDNVLNYIKDNYQNKITIRDMAETVNLSESHLFSVFKKEMGTSPITYLNHYRLSIAADELLKTNKTITEISDMVGIENSVYFNKLFRKAYQMSPSKYRKVYHNDSE